MHDLFECGCCLRRISLPAPGGKCSQSTRAHGSQDLTWLHRGRIAFAPHACGLSSRTDVGRTSPYPGRTAPAAESCRNIDINQGMNRSNISGSRTASNTGGVGAAGGGESLPARSSASRPSWSGYVLESFPLTSDGRQSAVSGSVLAPRSQLPDWGSAAQSAPGGSWQGFPGTSLAGPQGRAGSAAPTSGGGGSWWAQSQTGSMVSAAGWPPLQPPAPFTDEIASLLSNEPAPSLLSWRAPASQGGTDVGTQHSGVPSGGAAGAASSSHVSLAPPGSEAGGWAASQMGRASGAVAQSQAGSVLPAAGGPPPQWLVPSTDKAYNWFSNERPPSMLSFAASPSGAGGAQASTAMGGSATGSAASAGTPSTRRSVQDLASRVSQWEFNHVANAVKQNSSVRSALDSIGRQDIATSTMRRWLRNAGVGSQYDGPDAAYSAKQIEFAMQAQADHIRSTGSTLGSARAAYNALGGPTAGNWSTFRDYLRNDGLTAHGKAMLDQARAVSSSRGAGNPD